MFWRKKSASGNEGDGRLVIFFASDLHGSNVCFKKFLNAAQFYDANVLFMGGDITGKALMPICEQSDGAYLAFQAGTTKRLTTVEEVDEFVKRNGDQGFYPCVMSEEEYRRLREDEEMRHELFKKLVLERVREWCELAGGKLSGKNVPVITAPGNDDFLEIDEILRSSPYVQFHEMEVSELGGYEILHCGGSNYTPWNTEREFSEEEYEKRFAELLPKVKNMGRCIFNVHVPPHGTALDQCSKLDDNLQVVYEMGNPVQIHAGSTTLYNVIKEQQPLLGLHGHIHEGRGNIRIGKTICINPGSVYPEGLLQGVLVTLAGGEVKAVHMTQG